MRKQAQDNEHQERIAGPFRKGESVRLEHRFTEDTQGHLFRIGIIAELREQYLFTFVYITFEIDIRFIRAKFITISGSRKLAIFTRHRTGIKLAIEVDYLRIYVVADIRTMQIRYRLEIKPPYIRILKSGTRTNYGLDC